MRQVNIAVVRERYVILKIEDILTKIHGNSIF